MSKELEQYLSVHFREYQRGIGGDSHCREKDNGSHPDYPLRDSRNRCRKSCAHNDEKDSDGEQCDCLRDGLSEEWAVEAVAA